LRCAGYGGWRFYIDRQTVEASAAFDSAMKAYRRIGVAPDPALPMIRLCQRSGTRSGCFGEVRRALRTNIPKPIRKARSLYYALTLEDLERHNQALEELKKISGGSGQRTRRHGAVPDGGYLFPTGKPTMLSRLPRAGGQADGARAASAGAAGTRGRASHDEAARSSECLPAD